MPRRTPVPPGRDPRELHPALRGGHVVIASGEEPIYPQHARGPQGHAALGALLERDGLDYEPVNSKYAGKRQPAYIVHVRDDGEVEKAKDLAKRMGQESVIHSRDGRHQLVYVSGPEEGKATSPASGLNWFGDREPEDNFTTLYGPGGEPVGHFSYNIDFDHPLVPHGPDPTLAPPEAARVVLKSAVDAYRGLLLELRKREVESSRGKRPSRRSPIDVLRAAVRKYEVEARLVAGSSKPPSDDVSAQGVRTPPSAPYSHNIAGGGPLKTFKSETKMRPIDLVKSQAASHQKLQKSGKVVGHIHKECPLCKEKVPNVRSHLGERHEHEMEQRRKNPGDQVVGEYEKAEETPGESHSSEETSSPEASMEKGSLEAKLGTGKKDHLQTGAPAGTNVPIGKSEESPFDPTHGPHAVAKTSVPTGENVAQQHGATVPTTPMLDGPRKPLGAGEGHPTVRRSVFKKKTAGLGKSEFFIDLNTQSDPKKRLKEIHPVTGASVPGGKETGWETGGQKPKDQGRSGEGKATGGDVHGNKPKTGPDQKNTSENSVVEGNPGKKAAPKNDAIEKAQAPMSAPKAPSAPGAGSPKLSAAAPTKPPQAGTHANGPSMAKAGPNPNSKSDALNAAFAAGNAQAGAAAPKAQPRPPSDYDPSLFQPQGPVKSGLELAGPSGVATAPAGTGVTPKPAAPAKSPSSMRGIRGFGGSLKMSEKNHRAAAGKNELCKTCGKSHAGGECR